MNKNQQFNVLTQHLHHHGILNGIHVHEYLTFMVLPNAWPYRATWSKES